MKKIILAMMCSSLIMLASACTEAERDNTHPLCNGITCDHGTCQPKLDGTSYCQCDAGYENLSAYQCVLKSGLQYDPCKDVTCSNHGKCNVNNNTAVCNCDNGYIASGLTCISSAKDPCEGVTCSGHGTCSISGNTAICTCDIDYQAYGLTCTWAPSFQPMPSDLCANETCSGHGTCNLNGDAPVCNCDSGYEAVGMTCIQQTTLEYKTAEDWARARISGKVSTEDAFNAIAYSSGFPVVTNDNTVIFMHWYNDGNWSVAGDFNNWEPQPMTHDNDIWFAEVPLPNDVKSKNYYKFVNGDSWVSDPWSLRYTFTEDGEISYIVQPNDPHLMRWHGFKSPQGLQSRTIRAYIPANYNPDIAYDVLYAHDGQNLFGPGAEYGSWKVEEAMAALNANFIVVGIDNSSDRFVEYTHVDEDIPGYGSFKARGRDYAAFVHHSVRPFIEHKFKTTSKRGLMGSSLGGLISLYIPLLYPGEYKVALALSPTTAWGRFSNDDGLTIETLYIQAKHQPTILYLDNGGYNPGSCAPLDHNMANNDESNTDNYCFTRHFVDTMADVNGYTWEKDLFHYFDEGALHNEAAWAKRLKNTEFSPLKVFINAN